MKSTVRWTGGLAFEADPPSGRTLAFDGDGEQGFSPMEAVISALGACSAIDVVMILEKGRHTVTACHCELEGERAEAAPRVFTRIRAHFVLEGENLSEKAVERAVDLSFGKYCSVSKMLDQAVAIEHSFELRS